MPVCNSWIDGGLEADDIVVDCGNSQWTGPLIRREAEYKKIQISLVQPFWLVK